MTAKFIFTKKRCITFLLVSLLPLMVMGLSLYLFSPNFIFNRSLLISFVVIPLIAVVLLALCIFSQMKLPGKVIWSILILIAFAGSFFFSLLVKQYEQVERYTAEEAAWHYGVADNLNQLMPSLSEIGDPTEMEYIDYEGFQYIFVWDAEYLFCQYSPEEYALQKQQLEGKYVFREENITIDGYEFEPSVEIDGYQFRVLTDDGEYAPYIDYPKYMVLVGYSDEAREIVYLSFFDTDLDYITSLTDFLNGECGWKHLR